MRGQATAERVAVSLVTGFLGSGKTTLIAALLKQPAMQGTAVIVNEFGAVGIDDAIFAQSIAADNVLLLANGCLCCTAGDDLAATIWRLARRGPDAPSRILVETSGLADPAPVLRRLIGDPRLKQAVRLDAVVATIDAVNGLMNLESYLVAARQCAIADRRLITKTDLVAPEAVAMLASRLNEYNPGADIREVEHGRIEADKLFGASLYGGQTLDPDVDRWLGLSGHRAAPRHNHAPTRTWLLEKSMPVDWERLSGKLGLIIGRYGDVLLRVKGVIHTVGEGRPLVIHGVQGLFHPPVMLARWTRAPGTSIVIIGDEGAAEAVAHLAEALADAAVPMAVGETVSA
jgi:G3E family GTPase